MHENPENRRDVVEELHAWQRIARGERRVALDRALPGPQDRILPTAQMCPEQRELGVHAIHSYSEKPRTSV